MPEFDIIDSLIDTKKVQSEATTTLKLLQDIYDKIQRVRAAKITLDGSKSFDQVAASIRKVKSEEEELIKISNQVDATYKKRIALETEQAKVLAEEKLLLQQRNQELKNQVKEDNAAEGSIEKLRATLNRLTSEYDKLGAAERGGNFGVESQKNIQILTDELKQLEGETGRSQRKPASVFGFSAAYLRRVERRRKVRRSSHRNRGTPRRTESKRKIKQ